MSSLNPQYQKQYTLLIEHLQEAQKAYNEAPQTGRYDLPLTILKNAAKIWQRLDESIEEAEGGCPSDLLALQIQMQNLRQRAELALEAFNSSVARDGLVRIEAYSRRQGTDPTLTALEEELREQVKTQIPQLVAQASIAEQVGELTYALDLLRQANAFEPGNKEIEQQFVRLQKRQKQEERLQAVLADYQRKLATNSYRDAIKSLREGLEIFLEPDAGLPVEAEVGLRQLIQMVVYKGENVFAFDSDWVEAQTAVVRFTSAVHENTMGKRALQILGLWLEASRTQALRSVVASTFIIEDKLKGHRAARKLLEDEPHNSEFRQQFTDTKQIVVDSLNESASRRLQRGWQALETGDYEAAIVEANRVENEIYGPPEQEFEDFFAGERQVSQNRAEAEEIVRKAYLLREKDERTRPFYTAARDAFFQNNLTETQRQLGQITDVTGLRQLEIDLKQLREKLEAALKTEAEIRQRLDGELVAIRFDLANTFDRNVLQARQQALLAFPDRDLKLLPTHEQKAYKDALENVQARIEELQASEKWYLEGQLAWERQDYKTAIQNLEQAKSSTPQSWIARQIDIQKLLDQISDSSTKRFEDAKRFLAEEKYDEAFNLLLTLQADGEDVEDWLRTSQAGQLFSHGKKHFNNGEYDLAETNLQETLKMAQGRSPAFNIYKEANSLLHNLWLIRIEQLVEKADQYVQDLSFYNAENLLETEYIEHLLSEQYPLLSDSPKKLALIVEVKLLLATIKEGRKLLGMIQEAESFLSTSNRAEAWRILGKVLDNPDGSPMVQKIKKRAEAVMESKKPLQGEYEDMVVFILQRIKGDLDPVKAMPYLRWFEAQRKLNEEYDEARKQSEVFSKEIVRQIETSRQETLKSMRKWEWLSILAAFVAFGFLAYAGFFVIQWREPLTYLSTLPALLTGISAPFIHNHYKRAVTQMNAQYAQSLEQWKTKEAESSKRQNKIFDDIMGNSQLTVNLISE